MKFEKRHIPAFTRCWIAPLFLLSTLLLTGSSNADGTPFGESTSNLAHRDINSGFLFVDGEYISPPYQFTAQGEQISINGQDIAPGRFDLSEYLPKRPSNDLRRNRRRHSMTLASHRKAKTPEMHFLDEIQSALILSDIVVLRSSDQPLFLLQSREGQELLRALIEGQSSGKTAGQPVLANLVDNFEMTPEFFDRAEPIVKRNIATQRESVEKSSALVWTDRIGFPLTIIAMVLVVMAFGHLLSHAPNNEGDQSDPAVALATKRTFVQSLIFVALLSAIDLVWTIVASQSGSMRELNPLGGGLIESPMQLAAFKMTMTALAIGILYQLRGQQLARTASWWSCLVLTLLTARWLTFQSMFL